MVNNGNRGILARICLAYCGGVVGRPVNRNNDPRAWVVLSASEVDGAFHELLRLIRRQTYRDVGFSLSPPTPHHLEHLNTSPAIAPTSDFERDLAIRIVGEPVIAPTLS